MRSVIKHKSKCKFCKETKIMKRFPCDRGCETMRMAKAALEKAGGAE